MAQHKCYVCYLLYCANNGVVVKALSWDNEHDLKAHTCYAHSVFVWGRGMLLTE